MPRRTPITRTIRAFVDTGKLSLDAAFAGLVALVPMSVVLFSGPLVGLPRVHLPMLFASMMAGVWAVGAGTLALGWLGYVVLAAVIGVAYSWSVSRTFDVTNALTGAVFGVVPWAAIQLFLAVRLSGLMPGGGWFTQQALVMLTAFVVHGAVMGAMLRVEIERHAMIEV
jgi:hypothetical protein